MNITPVSVLTIVKSRQEALHNLVLGLERAEAFPAELVIVHMNEPASELASENFPVRTFRFDADERLPLAAARNFAAEQAASPFIIFLDVDCIPAPQLVGNYLNACRNADHLWIGPVRYLRQGATLEPGFLSKMWEASSPDPVRADLREVTHALFWSLSFACSKEIYDRIGGFDTRFTGYGAEDTDFGFTARQQGIALSVADAIAYHQYHASYDPPLNHFEDILTNAKTFFMKWKKWPMEGWLKKFADMGLIAWEDNEIRIVRKPGDVEIAAALKL
ncbi:galactosyltransferase-related protein [Dyadobacter chenwenxiniae]|uniref:Glycosyltransferase n=1 Tax=Dyadobacter chenwenxiniae TaxID=2906456 RepID=A0A9X1PIB7_9BACT|nr:glycosyltransferase [Dyadobacter chenwenxiniae]MCF0060479.1 glycosyltransferase [Dyadobacter chenwenxiniae]UON86211.1 galactosyltransferase-related protein [Dyadobacter chenwenxiniae]